MAYKSGLNLSEFDLNKQITELKQDYGWIKEINAQTLQQSVKNLNTAYTSFFRGGGFPKFKSKNRSNNSYKVMSQGVKVDFENKTIKLLKIKSPIRCKFDREFSGNLRNVTISKSKTGKYFVSILVETEKELPPKNKIAEDNSIGIDVGLNHFLVTSAAEFIDNPRYLRKMLERIKVLQKRLRNKLTTKIVHENQGAIIVEDLNVKGMSANHKLALSIMDASWSEFFRQL